MIYTFGECTLDDQLYRLYRAGTVVKVEPKAFDLLAYLIAHRDRVISRDELFAHLWPGQIVSEAALTYSVAKARKAVRDDGIAQAVIKTEHSRGYRFVSAVTESREIVSPSRIPVAVAQESPSLFSSTCPTWQRSQFALPGFLFTLLLFGWTTVLWQFAESPLSSSHPLQSEKPTVVEWTAPAQEDSRRWWLLTTENPVAWDYLRQGWRTASGKFSLEANTLAQKRFTQAIALDPDYAAAHVGLGLTYWKAWWFGNQDPSLLAQAAHHAEQAVMLSPSYPYAYLFLADVSLMQKRYSQATAAARRAVALDPSCARCYAMLAKILTFAGQPEKALGLIEQARQLDPVSVASYLAIAGHAYRLLGRYEEAQDALQRAVSTTPDFSFAHAHLAVVYSEIGRQEDAQAILKNRFPSTTALSQQSMRHMLPYRDPHETERLLSVLRPLLIGQDQQG